MKQHKSQLLLALVLMLGILLNVGVVTSPTRAADDGGSETFPQTGHTVSGKFLQYWKANGGLPVYGYPITDAQNEVDPETGKTFLTQWFERNRFELHPENAGTKYEVLLGLLGKDLRREALTHSHSFFPTSAVAGSTFFAETKHNIKGSFLSYWQQNGGLERFGFPINEESLEIDPETGKAFVSQWFERARFEHHPENTGTQYEVLLGLLGKEIKTPKPADGSTLKSLWRLDPTFSESRNTTVDVLGNTYVISIHDFIAKYDASGKQVAGFGGDINQGDNRVVYPLALTIDTLGNIYVYDGEVAFIKKFDSNGRFLFKWNVNISKIHKSNDATSLAIDSHGNVYTNFEHMIQKFDSQGTLLLQWSVGEDRKDVKYYQVFAIDAQDNIYVSNSEYWGSSDFSLVYKYNTQGQLILKWGGVNGTGDGQLNEVRNIVIDNFNQTVYIADTGVDSNTRIQKFSFNGSFLGIWGVNFYFAGKSLAVDKQGFVYLNTTKQHYIQKYDSNAKPIAKLGVATDVDFACSDSVALDNQNNVYIFDKEMQRSQKFDTNGHFVNHFTDKPSYVITVDKHGNLYQSIREGIQKFSPDGKLLITFPTERGANEILVDGNDNIYAFAHGFSRDSGLAYVYKYDATGKLVTGWAKGGKLEFSTIDYPSIYNATLDAENNLYISLNEVVSKYDSNGNLLTKLGTYGRGAGQFTTISSLAADNQGFVYMADYFNKNIQKFDKNFNLVATWNNDGNKRLLSNVSSLRVDSAGNFYLSSDCGIQKLQPSN